MILNYTCISGLTFVDVTIVGYLASTVIKRLCNYASVDIFDAVSVCPIIMYLLALLDRQSTVHSRG